MVLQIPYIIKLLLGTEVCPDSVYVSALECVIADHTCQLQHYLYTQRKRRHAKSGGGGGGLGVHEDLKHAFVLNIT